MFESYWVLHRYVIREYLKVFVLSLSGLILIYVVVLFFQKMNLFSRYNAPFHLIFVYFLYKIPEVTFQWTLPYAVLLATLLTLGNLSRHSEITAMKAGDRVKVDTLRYVLSQISYAEIDKHEDLTDAEIIILLQKELKKRKEAKEL